MEGSCNYGTVKNCNPVVNTVLGRVMGENRNGIAVFRGIPYGADTGGRYRFQAPRAAQAWDGIRDCSSKNGPICPQFGQGSVSNPNVPYWDAGHPEKFRTDTETRAEWLQDMIITAFQCCWRCLKNERDTISQIMIHI